MATNPNFANFTTVTEQTLLQNLNDEMIQIFGFDTYYVIRDTNYIDPLFVEAPTSSFSKAIPIEMYLENFEGFAGDGDLLSKFGLNVADKLYLSVSRGVFKTDIGTPYSLIRPREGDLVYFPFTNGIFEIKFVEHEQSFYQTGTLQYYQLQMEKFSYNSERFYTGIADLDSIENTYSVADDNYSILTEDKYMLQAEDGSVIVQEDYVIDEIDTIAQNDDFEELSDDFIDWSSTNPFSEGSD